MKLWRYGQSVEYLGRRYRLDGMLGSGGMADVCLAWDEREQREVALKILKSDDLDQETLNRFMKEAAQIAHWLHPHILRVYESLQVELIDAANGSVLFYMVSEYARGGDLQKRLTPGRPFPLSATFALFRQLCDAVQYAHEHGVIHRDLKPLNMLFRRPESGPEEVVLSDFGLAVQVEASHYTFAHGGTLAYMAPEQFQGHALPASDIFALGVILYLLCTGGLPFRRTLQDMPRIVQGQTPVPTRPSLVNPELPPLLDDVLLRAVRELPAERYRQPRELWEAIELALTLSARTFPSITDFWQDAGQTRPYEGAAQARSSRQPGQAKTPTESSRSVRDEELPEVKEGPVSALWIAREKQKASPVRLPLPTHSIPISPNPAENDAAPQAPSEQSASSIWQPGDERAPFGYGSADPSIRVEEPWRDARAEQAGYEARARDVAPLAPDPVADESAPRARRVADNPAHPTHPATSLSGSTILPGPRGGAHDGEQTSRRLPADDPNYQTSQRRQGFNVSEGQRSRRQSFEPPDAATDEQGYPSSRPVPEPLARQIPRRQPFVQAGDDATPQSSRRSALPRADYATRAASAYDASAPFEDEAYPLARARASAASKARASGTSSSHYPSTSAQRVPDTQASSIQRRVLMANPARKRRRVSLVAILGGVLVLALLLAILAAATFQGRILTFFGAPVTTVTLQPRAQLVQESAALNLRVDGGQPGADEIPGRQLSATSPTQSATAHATGTTQGKRATGELTFLNETNIDVTIQSTTITDKNGVKISFDGPIIIPANPPSTIIAGFAVDVGASGNIPTLDLDQACCAPNNEIFVKNTAFTGGQDGQPNSVLQQKDIDGAARALVMSGQAQAKALLQQQTRANERVANAAQCQARTSSDQKVGAQTGQATVQVAVTCSESVYNADAASQFFRQDLQRMARANPALGVNCALTGQIALTLLSTTPAPAGSPLSASLQFHAQGLWTYQFTSEVLHHLASLIAGKSQETARSLLLQQPGVSGVQFSRSGTLPVNTSEIQINV